jgi:hypothetical protein
MIELCNILYSSFFGVMAGVMKNAIDENTYARIRQTILAP